MAAHDGGDTVRQHVIFTGRVQGVCFRAISQEIARGFRVGGWVRNLPDGTVEMEAEGAAAEVERYLQAVQSEFVRNITNVQRTTQPPQGDETRFQVRY